MSWFKTKEKCAVVGCGNHVCDETQVVIWKQKQCHSFFPDKKYIYVCMEHEKLLENEYESLYNIRKNLDLENPKPQSDIDHILWLMDKFPVEDFKVKQMHTVNGFPFVLFFKGVAVYENFSIRKDNPVDNKLREKKEAQRQAVLNEMADERIASKEANDVDPFCVGLATGLAASFDKSESVPGENKSAQGAKEVVDKAMGLLSECVAATDEAVKAMQEVIIKAQRDKILENNESIRKAYKRKAKAVAKKGGKK